MDAFDVLADPSRRRILELLATGERRVGELVDVLATEDGRSQPFVSRHLGVLRDTGFVSSRADGAHRVYRLEPGAVMAVGAWLDRLLPDFSQPLDALATEVARGRRDRGAVADDERVGDDRRSA